MKKIILISLLCLFPLVLFAKKDVVYLNNGNVVSGKIIERKTNGTITIQTFDKQELTYTQFDYWKLDEGRAPKTKTPRKYMSFEDRTGRLHFFAAELSGSATMEYKLKSAIPLQFSVVNGLRFGQFISVGVGVGVRYYINNNNVRSKENPWTFPIYANLRGNLISHKGRNLVPYWSLDGGYNIGDDQFFFSPTLGVSIGGYRNNILVGIFYMGQFVKSPFVGSIKENSLLDGLGIKVGFQF